LASAAAVAAVGASAWAGAAGDAQPEQQLQEVVVTAQKVQQTLEQVPASVTSVSGNYIRDTGARGFSDLSSYTANTNLNVGSSSTQLLIRGFGTLNDVPGLDPSVGVVVDGVVYTYPEYLTAFFSDFDRYEVLRGPQGTLSGKNTTAGLLNITTNAPDGAMLIRSDAELQSTGNLSFRPVLNLPLWSGAALRFSGNFEHGDRGGLYNTLLKRPEQNPQQDSGRLRFRYDSHDGWTVDVGGFVSYQQENFNKQQLFIVGPNMKALDLQYDPQFGAPIGNLVSENVHAQENSAAHGLSLTFEGDLGQPAGMKSLKITSISSLAENVIGARDLDADFSPVPFIQDSLVRPEPERQVTQELRVSGAARSLFGLGHDASFVAGLYYDNYTLKTSDNFMVEQLGAALQYIVAADCDQHNIAVALCTPLAGATGSVLDGLLNSFIPLTGQPLLGVQSAQSGLAQRTRDYAAFGQGEWYFLDTWSLISGLRYAKENRTGQPYSYSDSLFIPIIADQQNFNDSGGKALRRTEVDLSPKLGLKYQPDRHTEAYFTWAEGYKSGGFNGIPLNPASIEYQPEKASSFEAGFKIKNRLLGGPIRGSVSVYRTHFGNLQVSTFQGTDVIIVNAADARSQGFETDMTWLLPVRGLSLYSSIGFADAKYTFYPNGVQQGNGICPGAPGLTSSSCNLTGFRLPFAPQWTAAATPAYTFLHLPYGVSSAAAVDVLYQGNLFLNPEDDASQFQKATVVINPRLVLADEVNGSWGLKLGIQNLTRQRYCSQIIDQPLAPGNFAAIRGDRGRVYAGSIFIDFL
jgi:outer membrane receptor protein involved in Fe transport